MPNAVTEGIWLEISHLYTIKRLPYPDMESAHAAMLEMKPHLLGKDVFGRNSREGENNYTLKHPQGDYTFVCSSVTGVGVFNYDDPAFRIREDAAFERYLKTQRALKAEGLLSGTKE